MTQASGWEEELAQTGQLTPALTQQILEIHGSRGRRAIEAVGEQRVKEYKDFIVVVGYSSEYINEGGSCNCKDTRYNLNREDPNDRCWHTLAYEIARRVGAIDEYELWYSDVHDFFEE